jgi:hypothetical protein
LCGWREREREEWTHTGVYIAKAPEYFDTSLCTFKIELASIYGPRFLGL